MNPFAAFVATCSISPAPVADIDGQTLTGQTPPPADTAGAAESFSYELAGELADGEATVVQVTEVATQELPQEIIPPQEDPLAVLEEEPLEGMREHPILPGVISRFRPWVATTYLAKIERLGHVFGFFLEDATVVQVQDIPASFLDIQANGFVQLATVNQPVIHSDGSLVIGGPGTAKCAWIPGHQDKFELPGVTPEQIERIRLAAAWTAKGINGLAASENPLLVKFMQDTEWSPGQGWMIGKSHCLPCEGFEADKAQDELVPYMFVPLNVMVDNSNLTLMAAGRVFADNAIYEHPAREYSCVAGYWFHGPDVVAQLQDGDRLGDPDTEARILTRLKAASVSPRRAWPRDELMCELMQAMQKGLPVYATVDGTVDAVPETRVKFTVGNGNATKPSPTSYVAIKADERKLGRVSLPVRTSKFKLAPGIKPGVKVSRGTLLGYDLGAEPPMWSTRDNGMPDVDYIEARRILDSHIETYLKTYFLPRMVVPILDGDCAGALIPWRLVGGAAALLPGRPFIDVSNVLGAYSDELEALLPPAHKATLDLEARRENSGVFFTKYPAGLEVQYRWPTDADGFVHMGPDEVQTVRVKRKPKPVQRRMDNGPQAHKGQRGYNAPQAHNGQRGQNHRNGGGRRGGRK